MFLVGRIEIVTKYSREVRMLDWSETLEYALIV